MEDFNQETDKEQDFEQDFEQEQNKTEFDVNRFKDLLKTLKERQDSRQPF